MAEGAVDQDRLAWKHTWAIVSQMVNVAPFKKTPIDILQFFPYADELQAESAPPPTALDEQMLERAFPGTKKE